MIINKHLGFYSVGDRIHRSRVDAILDSKEHEHVQWDFNRTEFSKFDWTVEPSETLDQLYVQRAKYLREKYNYLVLHYSGGSDSNNILNIFLRNKIRLDEVITYWPRKLTEKLYVPDSSNRSQDNWMSEWDYTIYPDLQWLSVAHPEIKITFNDTSDAVINSFKSLTDNWFVGRNALTPAGPGKQSQNRFQDHQKIYDHNKKTGHIMGVDKPRLIFKDQKFYCFFVDKIVTQRLPVYWIENPDNVIEFFYWSPDAVPLIIKQSQIIKKFFQAHPELIWCITGHTTKTSVGITAYHDLVRPLVYPHWRNGLFQAMKFDSKENQDKIIMPFMPENLVLNYYQGYNQLHNIVDQRYIDTDSKQIVGFVSQFYEL